MVETSWKFITIIFYKRILATFKVDDWPMICHHIILKHIGTAINSYIRLWLVLYNCKSCFVAITYKPGFEPMISWFQLVKYKHLKYCITVVDRFKFKIHWTCSSETKTVLGSKHGDITSCLDNCEMDPRLETSINKFIHSSVLRSSQWFLLRHFSSEKYQYS